LTRAQLDALHILKCASEGKHAAVLVLDPLHSGQSEIVYVSEAWSAICGISEARALRKDLSWLLRSIETDGNEADEAGALSSIVSHISGRRACKALALHPREGSPPFWSTLSLSPIVRRGELLLYVCALKERSPSVTAKLNKPPTARCRSTPCQQLARPFTTEALGALAKPAILELDPTFLKSRETAAGTYQLLAPPPIEHACMLVKRLGWYHLRTDAELLLERLVGTLEQLGTSYELAESSGPFADYFTVRARFDGHAVVRARGAESRDEGSAATAADAAMSELVGELELCGREHVIVNFVIAEESAEGTHCVTCTRLTGRTILFHRIYRQLHHLLAFTGDDHGARTPHHSAAPRSQRSTGCVGGQPLMRCSTRSGGEMRRSRRQPPYPPLTTG